MADVKDWRHYSYTVGELRDKLRHYRDDTPVIMSKDAEGNGHSPLSSVHAARYRAESSWSGDILDTEDEWSPEYTDDTYEDYARDSVPVVLLGPVN